MHRFVQRSPPHLSSQSKQGWIQHVTTKQAESRTVLCVQGPGPKFDYSWHNIAAYAARASLYGKAQRLAEESAASSSDSVIACPIQCVQMDLFGLAVLVLVPLHFKLLEGRSHKFVSNSIMTYVGLSLLTHCNRLHFLQSRSTACIVGGRS